MARASPRGLLLALSAYLAWGFTPLYFYAARGVPPLELTMHRLVFAALLLAAMLSLRGRWGDLRAMLGQGRTAMTLGLTAILICGNWLAFVWGIQSGRALEISLGYFVGPLINLVLGLLVLRERLSRLQAIAALLAVLGVANELARFGQLPLLALFMATSFGLYTLLRKQLAVPSDLGLGAELGALAVLSGIGLAWMGLGGQAVYTSANPSLLLLIAAAGPVTLIPLLLFTTSANLVPLALLGLLQYVAPSIMLLLAIHVFGEQMRPGQWWTFGCIWCGLALTTLDSVARPMLRRRRLHSLQAVRAAR